VQTLVAATIEMSSMRGRSGIALRMASAALLAAVIATAGVITDSTAP
jgi:hypothetical protein